jgi:hypothetical protein
VAKSILQDDKILAVFGFGKSAEEVGEAAEGAEIAMSTETLSTRARLGQFIQGKISQALHCIADDIPGFALDVGSLGLQLIDAGEGDGGDDAMKRRFVDHITRHHQSGLRKGHQLRTRGQLSKRKEPEESHCAFELPVLCFCCLTFKCTEFRFCSNIGVESIGDFFHRVRKILY